MPVLTVDAVILEAQDEESTLYPRYAGVSLRPERAPLIFCTVPPAAAQSDPAAPAVRSLAAGSDGIFINEVMFVRVAGGYEWIELKNGRRLSRPPRRISPDR